MRVLKIMLIILVLCSVSVVALSCDSEADSESTSASQTTTVQRGNLTVDIAASGNLSLSVMEDLAFEMAGTVEEVLVEEGESVEEGQVLARLDASEWADTLTDLELNLIQREISLNNAQQNLEDAQETTTVSAITGDIAATTTDAERIKILKLELQLAEANYEDALKALEEAQEKTTEITAPFDGFITKVNVEGGDEVMKGTVAVTLADPNKFEADILVSEMDIADVELGSTAWVEVDALGVILPAEVVHISPTAAISSGVVNYTVKVEVQSMEAIASAQPTSPPEDFTLPEGFTPPEDFTPPEGFTPPEQGSPSTSQTGAIPEDFQLREGMTVTVSLIVEEATGVLLIPNGAIITRDQQTYVQVVSADGTIEECAITTGVTNYVYTEVTEGLSEGEQVLVPEGTTTTETTTQQQGPPGGMFIPGMGGPP